MAEIITMPRLSDTMTEGVVAAWHKKVGDEIIEGDILADIETDKATMEFESFYEGTLLYIGIPEGEGAAVDSLLAIIGDKTDDVEALIKEHNSAVAKATPVSEVVKEEAPKPVAIEKPAPAVVNTPTVVAPVKSTSNGRIFASPLAKKLAQDKGISLDTITGSGENGRIVKSDIENYKASAAVTSPTFIPTTTESFE